MIFALDEAVEEWGSVHTEVGTSVCALATMLSSLCDIVTPAG